MIVALIWLACGFVPVGVIMAIGWYEGSSFTVKDAALTAICTFMGPIAGLICLWVVFDTYIKKYGSTILFKGRGE